MTTTALWTTSAMAQTAEVPPTPTAPSSSDTATSPDGSTNVDTGQSGTVQAPPVGTEGDEAGEEIIVTGIRGSLQAAIDAKRNSDQFLDAIVAADIGKLPDTNIAESLQRVSGVQIRRALGEGTSVSIRGLRQNRTEVNGRTLLSPNGRGRGFDSLLDSDYNPLSLFPAELISRLEVTKLLAPDQSDGSLGGTVNVITRKPLDTPGQFVALSGSGVYSDLADRFGYEGSALYSNSFADDTFGFLINATYSRKPIIDESFNSFSGFLPGFDPNGDGRPGSFIADFRFQLLEETRERFGGNLALQYRPSDTIELYGDVVYSHLDTDRRRDWLSVPLSASPAAYTRQVFSSNEVLVAGTINAPVQSNNERLTVASDTVSGALGARFESGPFTVRPELNYSYATLENTQTFVRIQSIDNVSSSFDLGEGGVPSLVLPATLNLTNPAAFRFANIFDSLFKVRAKEFAGRLDASYDFGGDFLKSLDVGIRYAELKTRRTSLFSQVNAPAAPPLGPVTLPSRSSSLYAPFELRGLINGQAPDFGPYLAAEPFGTGAQFACVAINVACTPRAFNPVQSFTIDEETIAAYAKLNIAADLGGRELTGNVGIRYTDTRREAVGAQIVNQPGGLPPVLTTIRATPQFEEFLPSAVLKYELTDEIVIRLGAAEVLGLPDSADLSPGITLATAPPLTGSAGNPNLAPFKAKQVDAAFEWYYAPGAALTVGLFYKDIESFVIRRAGPEVPPGLSATYQITRSVNGQGGEIKGVEVLFQQPLTFLPSPLDGFGVLANFSYIDSSTELPNVRGGFLPVEGLSKINYNLVGYYEKDGFGVRLAYNYRDKFFDSVASTGEGIFFSSYETLDASIRYEFGDFAIFADASNLTDSEQQRFTGSPEATSLFAVQGRRFSAGVNVKF